MPNLPTYEVHACKYAHLPRKAHEVQISPDPHDGDHPMDYFVWVAIPLGEDGKRLVGGQPIIIDTGFSEAVGTQRGRQMLRSPVLGRSHRRRAEASGQAISTAIRSSERILSANCMSS